jgi:hypothetical protein
MGKEDFNLTDYLDIRLPELQTGWLFDYLTI